MRKKVFKKGEQLAYYDRQKWCSYFQNKLDHNFGGHYITLSCQGHGGVGILTLKKDANIPNNFVSSFIDIEQQSQNSCQGCCTTIDLAKQHRADGNHYCLSCYLKHEIKSFLSNFEDKIFDLKHYLAEKTQDIKRGLFGVYCDVENYFTRKIYIIKNKLHEN